MDKELGIVTPMALIKRTLKRVHSAGLSPKNRNILLKFWGFIILSFIAGSLFFQTIYLLTEKYKDFSFFIIDLLLIIGYWQLYMKLYTLFTKRQSFSRLIDIIYENFWNLDTIGKSNRSEIQAVYNNAKLAVDCYTFCIYITLFGHCVTSYFRSKESLIINIWLPPNLREWNRTFTGHLTFYTIQAIFIVFGIMGLIANDALYVIFIALSIGQLRIIKARLRSISNKYSVVDNLKTIRDCVEQQNLIFNYLNDVEQIFSTELLHIAGSIIVICVLAMVSCLIEMSNAGEISRILTYILMFVSVFSQLFIYCYSGQLIQEETESVADAAYDCDWQNIPDKRIRYSLILIILRSQHYVKITMGGLLILGLETFTKISRTMLSLLTFMLNFDIANKHSNNK